MSLGDEGIDGMAILAQGIKELRRRCSAKDNSEPGSTNIIPG